MNPSVEIAPLITCLLLLGLPGLALAQEAPAPEVAQEAAPAAGSLTLGVGFDQYESFLAHARLEHTRLFGQEGLALRMDAHLSSFRQEAELSLEGTPALHGPLFWRASAYHKAGQLLPQEKSLSEQRLGGEALVGLQLSPEFSLAVGSRYELRGLRHLQDLAQAPGDLPSLQQDPDRTLATVFLEATWSQRQDPEDFFLEGWEIKGRLEHSAAALSSDYDFTSAHASLRYGAALPLGLRLQVQGRAGLTHSASASDVPLLERFRLGSPHSMGGLALAPLGPSLDTQHGALPLGGDAGAYGCATLYVPLWQEAQLYAFAGLEGGVIRDDLFAQSEYHFGAAAMAGLTWLSPIGPINAGYSVPIQRDDSPWSQEPMFFFSLGGGF